MTVSAPSASRARPINLGVVIAFLGLSQIVVYGTILYSFAIVAPRMAREFGVDPTSPFVALSVAMLLSGLASAPFGRFLDRVGPARVMAVGSIAVALCFGLFAVTPNFPLAATMVVVLQVVGISVMYGACFPTLAQYGGRHARRAMTLLTLVSGFSSTIFWPFSAWLVEILDWRLTYAAFALMHLLIVFPLHAFIASRSPPDTAEAETEAAKVQDTKAPEHLRRFAFWCIAASFTLTAIVSNAYLVHLVPILQHAGLGEQTYLVSMLVGPAMVSIRVLEVVFSRWTTPLRVAIVATLCFPIAALAFLTGAPPVIAGVAFVLLYGFGHGLNVIVSGTVPLILFGHRGYGELMGKLYAIRIVLSAGAAATLAFGLGSIGFLPSMTIIIIIGFVAVIPLLLLAGRLRTA